MTPTQAQQKLREFTKSLGDKAYVSVRLDMSPKPLSANIYLDGVCKDCSYECGAMTFEALFEDMERELANYKAQHHASKVRRMALKIIELTAIHGECDDARLRGGDFGAAEVAELGDEACAEANRMASNGPFKITRMVGSNAA